MHKILLCEDEKNIVSFLSDELSYEHYAVDVAYDGVDAVNMFLSGDYQLVLLDLMLPGKNGMAVLREIRKTSTVPVIILTARKDVYDKVALLKAGADDYITKPFETLELLARIERNIARNAKPEILQIKGMTIDPAAYSADFYGKPLSLTKTEFEILLYLGQNAGVVLSRDRIIDHVFGSLYSDSNIVDVNIKNIRHKLKAIKDEELISTVRGKGYLIRM